MPISVLENFLRGLEKIFLSKNPHFSNFSVENLDSSKALKIRFWELQSNCSRVTCRTTLIVFTFEYNYVRTTSFIPWSWSYLLQRIFWKDLKKLFIKKFIFFRLFGRKFWLFKSLKNKTLRLSEQLPTNYVSHDHDLFTVR